MSKPLRREDLETLLGIAPIYSYFVMPKKQMKYIYNDKVAILDCHVEAPFEGWLNMEAEVCRKAFLP